MSYRVYLDGTFWGHYSTSWHAVDYARTLFKRHGDSVITVEHFETDNVIFRVNVDGEQYFLTCV